MSHDCLHTRITQVAPESGTRLGALGAVLVLDSVCGCVVDLEFKHESK